MDTQLQDEVAAEIANDNEWLPVDEGRIDRDIERAANAARQGDVSLWVAGFYAARVVGKYQVDATREIARLAGRSVSSVENWTHAVDLYRRLRRFGVASELRQIRYELTITHFSTMWELQRKYDITPQMCMRYLDQMCIYRANREAFSSDALKQEVEAHENQSGKVITWAWARKSFASWLTKVAVMTDAPEWARAGAAAMLRDMGKEQG